MTGRILIVDTFATTMGIAEIADHAGRQGAAFTLVVYVPSEYGSERQRRGRPTASRPLRHRRVEWSGVAEIAPRGSRGATRLHEACGSNTGQLVRSSALSL